MRASSKKYKYSIAWSAKSGCTLFRRLFLSLHNNELDREPTNLWHHLLKDFPFDPSFKKTIVVSRNPYERVVSAFTNKMCGRRGHNLLSKKVFLEECTFKNFLIYLFDQKLNLDNIDIHIRPQSFSLNLLGDQEVFKVKLENFHKEIIEAYDYFGLQELIPSINKFLSESIEPRNATRRNDDTFFCGETIYSINETVFPEAKYFYNDELRELVREIYSQDFENFNYIF